ncbi:MAG: potassium channel family protein [Pseudomonadota bacterium]
MTMAWALGAGLCVVTIFIHLLGLISIVRQTSVAVPALREKPIHHAATYVSGVILLLIGLHLLEAALWAFAYIGLGEFDDFSKAFYFSIVTATTLGYGDITLSEPWRPLSTLEAIAGMLLFGASTALLFQIKLSIFPNPFRSPD